jgi:hypothetical protein
MPLHQVGAALCLTLLKDPCNARSQLVTSNTSRPLPKACIAYNRDTTPDPMWWVRGRPDPHQHCSALQQEPARAPCAVFHPCLGKVHDSCRVYIVVTPLCTSDTGVLPFADAGRYCKTPHALWCSLTLAAHTTAQQAAPQSTASLQRPT